MTVKRYIIYFQPWYVLMPIILTYKYHRVRLYSKMPTIADSQLHRATSYLFSSTTHHPLIFKLQYPKEGHHFIVVQKIQNTL